MYNLPLFGGPKADGSGCAPYWGRLCHTTWFARVSTVRLPQQGALCTSVPGLTLITRNTPFWRFGRPNPVTLSIDVAPPMKSRFQRKKLSNTEMLFLEFVILNNHLTIYRNVNISGRQVPLILVEWEMWYGCICKAASFYECWAEQNRTCLGECMLSCIRHSCACIPTDVHMWQMYADSVHLFIVRQEFPWMFSHLPPTW